VSANNAMLQAALSYVAQGFKVFPVKLDKTPYTPHGLKDATQLQVRVREFWTQWPDAGIGLVTDGFLVPDFDQKSGGLESKASIEAKYGTLPRTRTHRTGGGGLHYIYRNPNGTNIRNTVALGGYQGVDLRANGGYIIAPPSQHESGNQYEIIDAAEIARAPAWLLELATRRVIAPAATTSPGSIKHGERNYRLFKLASGMRRQGASQNTIYDAVKACYQNDCEHEPPITEDELHKIAASGARYLPGGIRTHMYNASGQNEPEAKGDTNGTHIGTTSLHKEDKDLSRFEGLSQKVRLWVQDTRGWWETRELDSDLNISGPRDKENRKKILQRLREQGVIEQHPKINKQFRFINTRITSLDFKTASNTGVLPLKWPMGIEKYVNLFPGNIAVVAGSPNSGKTALLLNFIYLNQDSFPLFYFCSEMGPVELRDRLDKFPGMDIKDWHFDAIERASDFADVIRPDCVNIVDYLEMTTELYLVNTHLTAISHKLGSGLALVAVQKKQGALFGRGQEFGLEKPKLYLSMDKGKLVIIKGKSWATENVDPNGLKVSFKITGGYQFEQTGEWDWEK
jgi:hypothetical protein